MRRRHNQNVRDYSKDQVLQRVSEKLAGRHQLLAPCPFKPTDVYRFCWTKEERSAIRLLKERMPTILHKDDDMTLQWDTRPFIVRTEIAPDQIPLNLYVKFPKPIPVPQTEIWRDGRDSIMLSRLPDHLLDTIEEWAKRWAKLQIETTQVYEKVDRVFTNCNTMGQIHRLWPNLCSFLPERGQEVLRKMKVRSKLPEAVLHYADDDEENERPLLDLEWRPEALRPYDAIITEALLLPDVEGEEDDWKVRVTLGPAPT